ncbi:MAG: potassium channel family protein [Sphingobium sp.]|uniref:potassium channel family protein n=1 Tax=Sphingobium sp. TaxID=1912891 RepID=UPI0029B42B49|nr:potassium channel family protein [Sphingobium sp.]MDX3910136.1 potassium channel family protein [Sphingobium sp.]
MANKRARAISSPDVTLSLMRRGSLTVGQSLLLRAGLALSLMAVALAGHWFDRDGLRDNVDGAVSFVDILYFTAVTITTVGYGDIVPVTPQARLFDTFVVTPIRLFVWLIFLGTAYTFVFQRTWDRIRTRMIEKTLYDHHIVCGFGAGGEAAVTELIRQGIDPKAIVVIDCDPERVAIAVELGVTALTGDATHNATLDAACVDCAKALLVAPGRDDTAALIVLSARQLNPTIPISASVRAVENEDLLSQAGAASIINPVSLGGHLLARSSTHRGAVDYIRDLAAADGRVALHERLATASEVGRSLRSIGPGLAVRLLRAGRAIGFWEEAAETIEAGDAIIEIVALTEAAPSASAS